MQTQVDIQDIIKRLMAGQPVDNWSMNSYQPQSTETGDGSTQRPLGAPVNVGAVWDGNGAGYSSAYDMDGNFRHSTADESDASMLKSYLGDALKIGGAMSGLSGFGEMMSGGSFLSGAQAPFNAVFNGGVPWGGEGLETGSTFSGGGGFDALTKGFSALPEVAAAGTALGSTVAPLTMAELGIGGALTSMAAAPSFLDKLGNFASDPSNILKTIGTVGGLYEAFNGKDPGNFTQTTNKTLDPRIDSAVFGPGGLLGQIKDFGTANPGGMNDAMRTGQNGLLGMASNPGVLDGFNRLGANGLGLLGRGIASNPWLTKAGG